MKKMKSGKKCSKCMHSSKKAKSDKHKMSKKTDAKMKKTMHKDKVEKVMKEYKHGELHSGSKKGPKVKSRKQAIAIALSESRRMGKKK